MNDPVTNFSPQHVFRFCPACSSKSFNYRQNNSFLCENCGFEFYINASAAVAALIEDNKGRILFAKRAKEPMKGKLDLPGGFVDISETAEDAMQRELREELNLIADEISFFTSQPNTYLYGGITYFTLDLAFICKVQNFKTIAPDDDVDGYQFIALDDIDLDEIGLASIKKIVSLYLASKKTRNQKQ
jgi:NAD+ diphosphatase